MYTSDCMVCGEDLGCMCGEMKDRNKISWREYDSYMWPDEEDWDKYDAEMWHDVHYIRAVRGLNPSDCVSYRPCPWSNPDA